MKPGTVAAVVIVVLYFGLEAYAGAKARYRMEPDYILGKMVAAETAAERCGDVSVAQASDFERVRDRVEGRLRRTLADAEPPLDSAAAESEVSRLERETRSETVASLEVEGCDSPAGRALIRQYGIYASK